MKIRIERKGDNVLTIHRLYGEGVPVNEITRPQPDKLISEWPFDKLEACLKGDKSMIVDVPDPAQRSTYPRLARAPRDSGS
jgi:hypothetical protein